MLIVDDVAITNAQEIALADWETYVNSGGTYYYFWVDASGTRQIKFITTDADGDTYKLYYFKKPTTDLDADSDTSVYPDEYRSASVFFAAGELLNQIGKTQLADRYLSLYARMAEKARVETEEHYMNMVRAVPDISDEFQFDQDKQGIGQV